MRICVGGSRTINDLDLVAWVIKKGCTKMAWSIDELIHGDAEGVDSCADIWACEHAIARTIMPVSNTEWAQYGRSRGQARNERMGRYAEGYLGIWDGHSPGTKNMIEWCRVVGKPHIIYNVTTRVWAPRPETK